MQSSNTQLDRNIAETAIKILQEQNLLGANFKKATISSEKTTHYDVKDKVTEYLHEQNETIKGLVKDLFFSTRSSATAPPSPFDVQGPNKNKAPSGVPSGAPPLKASVQQAQPQPTAPETAKQADNGSSVEKQAETTKQAKIALLEKSLDELGHILLDTPFQTPELRAQKKVEDATRTKEILNQLGYKNITANQAYNEIGAELDKLKPVPKAENKPVKGTKGFRRN